MAAASGETRNSPVRELLAERNFREFWIAQVLYAAVNGTLRFTFIWLVVTLTEWPSAEGLVAIAFGLPALFLSIPAGALSDRVDRSRLFTLWTGTSVVALTVFTIVIATGRATPVLTAIAAVIIGTTVGFNLANVQAIVPLLVTGDRLMNAVALQNGGGQAASFAGLAIAGLAISLLGDAGGFGLLTVTCLASVLLMSRVKIPQLGPETTAEPVGPPAVSIRRSIVDGARFGFGNDPVRTLLLLAVLLGSSFSVMQISIPRVVDEVYERGSTSAGFVLGAFGAGMMISSMAVAGRDRMRHGVNVARYIGVGLGMGQFALSFAPNVWVALAVMAAWGINAGVAMASHRTLMQTHTPREMMGRIMGLMMLGFGGGLPVGALISTILAPMVGPVLTMRLVGAVTIGIGMALTWRRSIIDLR